MRTDDVHLLIFVGGIGNAGVVGLVVGLNPDATCFSETNLLYMKNVYLLYQPYLEIAP